MCYSWEDFETGCSPLYRPNGEGEEVSFSRKKVYKEESQAKASGVYSAVSSLEDFEYIGAPCGGEDNRKAKDVYWNAKGLLYERPKQVVNLIGQDYSKLSNISINKGQDEMFSFYSPYKYTTPNYTKQVAENIIGNKKDTYRPLPDCLTIKESSIDGLGVFATEDIILDKHYTFLGYTHYVVDGELFRVNYGGFLNHSNTPNCKLYAISKGDNYEAYQLVPLIDIKAGSELTLDYSKELCGLSGYDGAEFLEDKLEDRVYENSIGVNYYYNETLGKYESDGFATIDGNFYPIFFTPEDAEKFLKRVK